MDPDAYLALVVGLTASFGFVHRLDFYVSYYSSSRMMRVITLVEFSTSRRIGFGIVYSVSYTE